MLIKICGNCQTYKYNNGPASKGGCNKKRTLSPLASVCDDYKPKRS